MAALFWRELQLKDPPVLPYGQPGSLDALLEGGEKGLVKIKAVAPSATIACSISPCGKGLTAMALWNHSD